MRNHKQVGCQMLNLIAFLVIFAPEYFISFAGGCIGVASTGRVLLVYSLTSPCLAPWKFQHVEKTFCELCSVCNLQRCAMKMVGVLAEIKLL